MNDKDQQAPVVYLISQFLIAQQFVDPQKSAELFKETLNELQSGFKEAFACLYLSKKYNNQSESIMKIITSGNQVRKIYENFISCLKS